MMWLLITGLLCALLCGALLAALDAYLHPRDRDDER